jgi:hypothetical protein
VCRLGRPFSAALTIDRRGVGGAGEDGKAVLEIIFAAYESAGTGRKVALPFVPPEGKRPVDLWLR